MISKKLQSNTTLPNKHSYKSDKIIFVQFRENIFGSKWNYWIIFIRKVLHWKVLHLKNYGAPPDFLHVLVIIAVTFLEFRTKSSVQSAYFSLLRGYFISVNIHQSCSPWYRLSISILVWKHITSFPSLFRKCQKTRYFKRHFNPLEPHMDLG